MGFYKKSADELNQLTIEEYIDYYEAALIAWNNKKINNDDLYEIVDEFSNSAYSNIIFLMGCCKLCCMGYRNIDSNILALKYELALMEDNIDNKEELQKHIDICKSGLKDIKDICDISIEGLQGTYKTDKVGYDISLDMNSLNMGAIANYLEEYGFELVENEDINGIDMPISIEDIFPGVYDSGTSEIITTNNDTYSTTDIGNWIGYNAPVVETETENMTIGNEANNEVGNEEDRFYVRIIDQNKNLDTEFRSYKEFLKFVDNMRK